MNLLYANGLSYVSWLMGMSAMMQQGKRNAQMIVIAIKRVSSISTLNRKAMEARIATIPRIMMNAMT